MRPRPSSSDARSRLRLLLAFSAFPVALTGMSAVVMAAGWGPAAVALGGLAGMGWGLFALAYALTRPVRVRWSMAEKAALRGGKGMAELLEAIPRREGLR